MLPGEKLFTFFQILHLLIQPLLEKTEKNHFAFLLIVYHRVKLTILKICEKIHCSPKFLATQRW